MASDKTIKVRTHADVPVTIGDMVALMAAPTVMRKVAAAEGLLYRGVRHPDRR
ncbi:hypothetical protein [Actinomadura sp. 9N215]|uniref:hypothetical protein n=1 Tax=Actinomadura sp. 9N215 TaxID=3375150 RepID=UPI0037B69BCB